MWFGNNYFNSLTLQLLWMKNMSKLNEVTLNLRVATYLGNSMEAIWGGGQPFDWQNHQNIFFPPICRGGCDQWHILVWWEGHQFLSSEVNNDSLQKGGGFFICCKSTEQFHNSNSTRSSPSGDHLQLTSTEAIKSTRLLLLLSRGGFKTWEKEKLENRYLNDKSWTMNDRKQKLC